TGAERTALSAIDRNTLAAIVERPHAAQREVAASMKIALSTLQYRVRSLESRGIIGGWWHAVPAEALGVESCRLLVHLTHAHAETIRNLVSFCGEHPNVVYCMSTLGTWDFEIGIECARSSLTAGFVAELYEKFGDVARSVRVLGELEERKFQFFPW